MREKPRCALQAPVLGTYHLAALPPLMARAGFAEKSPHDLQRRAGLIR